MSDAEVIWWTEIASFALLMAAGQFAPGPDMILLTRASIAEGAKVGCMMALGIASGLIIHSSFAVAGMAYLVEKGGAVELGLKLLASVYLLWITYHLTRSSFGASLEIFGERAERQPRTMGKAWVAGFLCNILNVKVVVALSTIVLPFLSDDKPAWWQWLLPSIIVIQGALLWCVWVVVLQHRVVRAFYLKAWRWIDRLFALLLLLLVGSLLLSLG